MIEITRTEKMRRSNRKNRVVYAAATLVACLAAPGLQAREETVVGATDGFDIPLHAPVAGLVAPGMGFITSEIGTSRLVKGAPYSAEAVSESNQVLMDGNKIQRRAVQRLARDGEGRTRIERLRRDGTVESVMINDVVAGKRFWLLPDKKRVIEQAGSALMPMHAPLPPQTTPGAASGAVAPPAPPAAPEPPAPPSPMAVDDARSWAEDMRQWARDLTARWRDEHRGPDAEGRSVSVDVVRVIEPGGDPGETADAIAAIPPVPLAASPPGQGVTTVIGSKDFDRVRADGSRTTWTIPAGKIGNEKPIEVTSERWYAPDLLLVVSSRYFDPRRGETTYRLTNLKRAEPDASLFKVPADYERGHSRRRDERGKD